jgi:hypothetical protein
MRYICLFASICTFVMAGAVLPAAAASRYDGTWSVAIVTEQGACNAAYSWDVAVTDGHIGDNNFFVQSAGIVDGDGRITFQLTHGSDVLAAAGAIRGAIGSGTWQSPTSRCSGHWSATKSS